MSFFQFSGNATPEEFKKTLENISSLQSSVKNKVDAQNGIDTKTNSKFNRLASRQLTKFREAQDDQTDLENELGSYTSIRKILTKDKPLDVISYIFQENPDLLPSNVTDTEIEFDATGLGMLGSEDLTVQIDEKGYMDALDQNGVIVFPGIVYGVGANPLVINDPASGNDYIDLTKSYNNVLFNLLLFDEEVLKSFKLLEGAVINDLQVYLDFITEANAGALPASSKIAMVQDQIAQGPVPLVPKKATKTGVRKLPRDPEAIKKLQEEIKRNLPKNNRYPRSSRIGLGMAIGPSAGNLSNLDLTASDLDVSGMNSNGYETGGKMKPGYECKPPACHRGSGTKANSAYIIQGGKFSDLDVDVPLLFNKLHLQVKKAGSIIIDQPVDKDTLDLLTHRLKPNKVYSDQAEKMLTKMISHSDYPVHPGSKKLTIAQQRLSAKRDKKTAKKKGEKYEDPTLERLITLTSEHAAGNSPNKDLIDEIQKINDALFKSGKINNQIHREIRMKYLFGK